MARKPTPGGDQGNWGSILNEFLDVAHNADGTVDATAIPDSSIDSTKLQNSSITPAKLNTSTAPATSQVLSFDGSGLAWIASSGTGVTDHGALTGLADDDHPQYHNDTRGDVRYYTKTQSDTALGGKANTTHAHAIADTTGLQTALDAKAATVHAHTSANITDLAETIEDTIGTKVIAGTNVTVSYNDTNGQTTIAATPGAGSTNLTSSVNATTVTVLSDTGTDVALAAATATNAGILTAADKTKLDGIAAGAEANAVDSVAGKTGAVTLVKADVGLTNVDNTSDLGKPISTATQTALDAKAIDSGLVHLAGIETVTGAKNFTGGLQVGGQTVVATNDVRLSDQRTPTDDSVSAAKLQSDAVTEAKLSAVNTPVNGQLLSYNGTNFTWVAAPTGGSDPVMGGDISGNASSAQIVAGAVGAIELATDAVTDIKVAAGAAIAQSKIANLTTDLSGKASTTHTHTKADVGLANVDNTSDLSKPVSTATQTALNAKSDTTHAHTKADVGLANVDNTSDLGKPISTATQTALNAKANSAHAHAAADITSGTVATARLGSGTADSTTYLRGDGAWATPASGGGGMTAVARTTGYTAAAGDFVVANAVGGGFTVTLPVASNGAFVSVKKVDSSVNAVLVVAQAGVQIDDQVSISVNTQWQNQDFFSDGAKWYRI